MFDQPQTRVVRDVPDLVDMVDMVDMLHMVHMVRQVGGLAMVIPDRVLIPPNLLR